MGIEKDEKYWKNYTEFINEVEKLTGLSPSDLVARYEELIEELDHADKEYYLEWQYELDNNFYTRKKIQKVINHYSISENLLFENFKVQIQELDEKLKKHILNYDQSDWWNNPELKFKSK